MNFLIRKACELGEKTAHCNVEVIINAHAVDGNKVSRSSQR